MKTIAIIQARTGSSRLPGKVLMNLGGKPDIYWVTTRMAACESVDAVLLATTATPQDDALARWAEGESIACFRGSEEDVLKRYHDAAVFAGAEKDDIIVRITGDCPLIDPDVCARVIGLLQDTGTDYACNINPPTYPDGLDCEAMRFHALQKAHTEARMNFEREHVTQYIIRHPELFRQANHSNEEDLSPLRWTLDEMRDYTLLNTIFSNLNGYEARMRDVCKFLGERPDLLALNDDIERNEGLQKSIQEENS